MDFTRMEEDLLRDEGLRLRPYKCSAGHLTIGVGHKVTPHDRITEGDAISLETAGLFLSRDIAIALGTANTIFGRDRFESLPDARQRALVNMIFNLGAERFAKFVKLITAIKERRWADAAVECLDSTYARQVGNRAIRVSGALRTGQD
ncbi:MAG: lysozyme [Opitutae bacterium]|nr:lysozyme [Opitutae bacterium]